MADETLTVAGAGGLAPDPATPEAAVTPDPPVGTAEPEAPAETAITAETEIADGTEAAEGTGVAAGAGGAPADGDDVGGRPGRIRTLARVARPYLRRPGFVLACVFISLVIVAGLLPSLFTWHSPTATSPAEKLREPSLDHLFGTDELGRDLFTRVVYGSTLTIRATGGSVLIGVVAGLAIGVVSGFAGGWLDSLLMRIVDVLLAIPALLLALVIVTALGFGTLPVAVAVGVGLAPGFARTTRAEVFRVRGQAYVEAARTGGASWGRVLVRHVLPNSWGPVAVLAVLDFGTVVLAISSLSFLGFGVAPPAAEWGTLISAGRGYLITSPWLSLLPGLFVGLVVFALNHIARTMEEVRRWE